MKESQVVRGKGVGFRGGLELYDPEENARLAGALPLKLVTRRVGCVGWANPPPQAIEEWF